MFANSVIVLLAAGVLLAQPAEAQTTNPTGFPGSLTKNDRVIVVTKTGETSMGRLAEIAAESIAVAGPKGQLRTFGRSDILEIKKSVPDGLGNGAIIGTAVGFAGTFLVCLGTVEDGFLFTGTEICSMGALVFGAPGGLVAGLIADTLHTKKVTVYHSPAGSAPRVRVAPVVTPSRVGVGVSVRLGR